MSATIDFLRSHYLDQPFEVSIETFTMCNAACTFCPYPTLERKGTHLSDLDIDRLLDQMGQWDRPFYLSPFKVNEPLLDKRLIRICKSINANVPQAYLRLFTNGSPLTVPTMHAINTLEHVTHLWISLNSHEPEEYQRIMSLDFDKTALRLDQLHALLNNGYFRHPVVLSKVSASPILSDTQLALLDFDAPFKQYCDKRWPLFQVAIIKQDGWLGYVPPSSSTIPFTPCARWFELSILSTGVVSLCCMDGKGEFSIGNIHEKSLMDIYNDPQWRNRRAHLLSRRDVHPCSTCTY